MKTNILFFFLVAAGTMLFIATEGKARPNYCENPTAYSCTDCHGSAPRCPNPQPPPQPVCNDNDNDGYNAETTGCGPVDCNDGDYAVNPGAAEFCGDSVDNDCDGFVDETCDIASCPDGDRDGFQNMACGGDDCNDSDPAVNPASEEACGNGVDENCNGNNDDSCQSCPAGSVLVAKQIYGCEAVQGPIDNGGTDDEPTYGSDDDDDDSSERTRRSRRSSRSGDND